MQSKQKTKLWLILCLAFCIFSLYGVNPPTGLKFKRVLDTPYPNHSGTKGGDMAVGDINGDKLPDILITGLQHTKMITEIFLADAAGYKKLGGHGLPGLDVGSRIALGDVDGDGDNDVVLYGKITVAAQTALFKVFLNDGKSKFSESDNLGSRLPSEDFEDTKGSWAGDDKEVLGLYDSQGWSAGGLELVDLNGDKALDIVYAACKGMESGTDAATQQIQRDWETSGVFLNKGKGKFELLSDGKMQPDISYPGIAKTIRAATATADLNKDGKPDLILTGQVNKGPLANAGIPETQRNGQPMAAVYLGKGDGTFLAVENCGLPGLLDGSVTTGDINQDGKIDVVLTGNTGTPKDPDGGRVTKIYHGNGDGTFKLDDKQTYGKKPNDPAVIRAVMAGDAALGDLDLDGDLDLVVAGNDNTRSLRIYQHENGIFSQLMLDKGKNGMGTNTLSDNASSDAVSDCDLAVIDIDTDGDLDIILNGLGGAAQLLVFRNLLK